MGNFMVFLITMLLFSYLPQEKVWIYFTDKGIRTDEERKEALKRAKEGLSERAFKRRLMTRSSENAVDYSDIPVYEQYIREIEAKGGRFCVASKWLNAGTFVIPSHKKKRNIGPSVC